MPISPGTRLGPYEVVSPLGAGGMGEVYRARDTRLGRDVAIKVLPQHLSEQPEIRARFEREAKTVSSLNHPHICVLHDVGREGATDYLVMELIEGDTLADRLKRGPLPATELLRLGMQVADALDRAHRAGVIHRDLKPGNIMVTRAGAKLMDFGLSRATGMAGPSSGSGVTVAALSQSPTIAQALTAEGTLLGTFQYMSPEQLEGREADARSDIWALGCVLYEMATGRRAFDGRSQASLIAAILEREPSPVGEMPPTSGSFAQGGPPHGIERLIRNCLAKDPEDRVQTAHDVKLRLEGIAETAGLAAAGAPASAVSATHPGAAVAAAGARPVVASRAPVVAWGIAALGILGAAASFGVLYPKATAETPSVRFRLDPIPGARSFHWPRISPDGRNLAVLMIDSLTRQRVYLRPIEQAAAHAVPGSEGINRFYWSPDGHEFVYASEGKVRRLSINGGAPVVICEAPGASDLSWGSKGDLLMDAGATDSLRVVPAAGGEPRPASRIYRAEGEVGSAWPCFLPDGRHFLFLGLRGPAESGTIRLGKLGTLESRVIGQSDGRVEYAPGGWVLFVRGSTLLAQKLDLGAGKLTGQPILLVDDLRIGSFRGHFTVSNTGVFAFARGGSLGDRRLLEYDRRGARVGEPLLTGSIWHPRISPDGGRILYERYEGTQLQSEVYAFDLVRRTDTRLTFTGGLATSPAWSPDGRRFAFARIAGKVPGALMYGAADGLGGLDSVQVPYLARFGLSEWSPAGSRLLTFAGTSTPLAYPSDGDDRRARALIDSTQWMAHACVSPDGRWAAGASGQLPNVHVFVHSLVGPPGRWQISNTPGSRPRWTKNGTELIYEGFDGKLMAVDIDTREGFRAGTPVGLFALPQTSPSAWIRSWDVSEDGSRFFVLEPTSGSGSGSIVEVATPFERLVARK